MQKIFWCRLNCFNYYFILDNIILVYDVYDHIYSSLVSFPSYFWQPSYSPLAPPLTLITLNYLYFCFRPHEWTPRCYVFMTETITLYPEVNVPLHLFHTSALTILPLPLPWWALPRLCEGWHRCQIWGKNSVISCSQHFDKLWIPNFNSLPILREASMIKG